MTAIAPTLEVSWEKLPDDFLLDDEPVNLDQPALAAALTESLELAGKLPATALTTTNYGICATVNRRLVVKRLTGVMYRRFEYPDSRSDAAIRPACKEKTRSW